jgi:hypothetical protein
MDLPGPTTSVGTRTDYSVGPWDYPACARIYYGGSRLLGVDLLQDSSGDDCGSLG